MQIYIDTSVINGVYAYDAPWIKEATKIFLENAKRKKYGLYISDLVIAEIERTANSIRRKKLLNIIIKNKLKKAPITEQSERLAEIYIDHGVIPHKYLPDALHIAAATLNKIPIIVSWNFKHMVRHQTRILVNKINKKHNFISIDICSPEEVN